ncbi:MAG: DNA-processing protein DprA [Phycisphaerales bacterium]|nr:DNA-processing protein DprA [Phycisphaerales bacterium]
MERHEYQSGGSSDPVSTSGVSDALLALDLARGLGRRHVRRLLDAFGTAEAVFESDSRSVQARTGCTPGQAASLRRTLELAWKRIDTERAAVKRVGCTLIAPGLPGFPPLLEVIPDPPLVMRVRGRLPGALDDRIQPVVAIVGSRRPTAYGLRHAGRFATHLSEHGFHVVSGGARGIDGASHRAVIDRGGETTVILGSGLGCPYPPEHASLFESILDQGGCLASEYPIDAPPRPGRFPQRNRIVSGLSIGVLVIEAAARSGALITARLAVEEQGREAMAIPGRIDDPASAGCLKMLREGWAALVRHPEEALETLQGGAALIELVRTSGNR